MNERRQGAYATNADKSNKEDRMETVRRFTKVVLFFCVVSVLSGACGTVLTANRTPVGRTGDLGQPRISVQQNDALIAPADAPGQRFGLAELSARDDEPEEATEFFALKRLPPGATFLPVERYQAAIEHMRQMPRYSTSDRTFMPAESESIVPDVAISLGNWTQLGPGNIGGRTRAILIDPLTPTTMYAAGVAGGVWKSTNGGASWSPVSDLIANLAVNSLAMDPANSSVIYAGTGEGYFNDDAVRGAGIFKTTNGGTTWTQLASTAAPTSSNFYFVNKIVVSPNNSQRVYAATRTGVFRSLDGGSTWSQVLNSVAVNGCTDLVIRTDQTADYMFAACGTFAQATVYRNTDAGGTGTWTAVLSETNMGRTSLAIAPSQQSTVYALSAEFNPTSPGTFQHGLHAVFRSTSNGDSGTWTAQVRNTSATKLNTLLLTNPVFASLVECGFGSSNSFFNQGWYDNVIVVDPVDPNRVWVGGIDLFRSTDGGANWSLASYWWISSSDPQYAHADQHAIVFHPQYNGSTNQTMFVGNDGGIFRTVNPTAGTSTDVCGVTQGAIAWSNLNQGYAVTQFYDGVPYPGGMTYFGGTQDNGTVRGTDAGGINGWTTILGGDGGYVAVDPTNTNVLYAENTRLSIQKSTNGGVSWASATSGITEPSRQFLFITPFVMDSSNPQRLWTGGFKMWRTTNGATSWVQASALTCGNGSVSSIAVAPTNANHVLAGISDGCINRTTIGLTSTLSTTWAVSTPRAGYVSWLAFDPTNENIAYATYSTFGGTHIWKSTDGGTTWAGIDGTGSTGIPDIPVHSIVVDPSDPSRLYVGTDLGVFASADGGATWAVENTGFANVITEALAIGTVSGTPNIFAFTHGRGAWRVATTPVGTRTLTVASSNPNSGVAITVTPNDNNGQGNGTTQFTRTYNNNTVATLTAPATAGGNNFQKWQRDGVDWSTPPATNVTMDADHTMTAVYVTPVVTRTLTVASSNPASGVSITVSPNDNNNQGNGTTQFTRIYNNNAVANLTAPATAGGNNFQKWQRDGVDWSFNQSTTVTMDANHTMTAVYASCDRILTVASQNPNSGVGITVSPNDCSGQGNGTTQFTRSYVNNNTVVTLTAPSTASGNNFQKWQRDGVDWSTNLSTQVIMDTSHTMTAVYVTPVVTRTLTVASSNPSSGVSITVSPNDNNGQGNGSTQFTRTYNNNAVVNLTAPSTAGGNNFQKWQRDGVDWAFTQSTNLTMDANHTMTAVYVTPSFTLTVARAGSGDGTVTSSPAGISCGATCQASFNSGTPVTLTASPAAGASFRQWSGACSGTSPTCTVTINVNTSVTATFSLTFDDNVLTPQVTAVRATHMTQLRSAIDTLRSRVGVGAFPWTHPTLTPGATSILAVHITELRTALNGVYTALGRALPTYTNPTITPGQTTIKKAHIAEIRSNVRAVE